MQETAKLSKKYDYIFINLLSNGISVELKELGDKGWRVVPICFEAKKGILMEKEIITDETDDFFEAMPLSEIEDRLIKKALEIYDGNHNLAACRLDLSITAFDKKVNTYNLK